MLHVVRNRKILQMYKNLTVVIYVMLCCSTFQPKMMKSKLTIPLRRESISSLVHIGLTLEVANVVLVTAVTLFPLTVGVGKCFFSSCNMASIVLFLSSFGWSKYQT